ncbi:MAG: exodeoxyribonuclease VII small subunit [Chloroflexi bacterium]|nr:MAG: exodeoxyribonuclease VII small subunit [Chloroflexota bacterium]
MSRSSWPRRSGAPTPASSSTASSAGSQPTPRSVIPRRRAREMAEVDQMDYETAVAELERTVQLLGKEQDDLAESVRTFERGLALARRCARLLDDAERRVKELAGAGERSPGP